MFSGCVNEKISAADDINMTISLMNSGNVRIEKIDFEAYGYSDAKIKLAASKVDYEEVLKILNNTITDYNEEKKIIEINKIVCSYSLDEIATLQNFIIWLEHLDTSVAYLEGDDFAKSRSKLKLADNAWIDSKPFISKAKEKCFSIDVDTIPVEYKSRILEDRLSIEQTEKMVSEFGEMIPGIHLCIDANEHIAKAVDHMENGKVQNLSLAIVMQIFQDPKIFLWI